MTPPPGADLPPAAADAPSPSPAAAAARSGAGPTVPEAAPRARSWRRWLPDSLFGRLMAVLVAGLLLAQLLSAALNVAERDRLIARGFGGQAAQRIADTVALLDGLGEADRARVVSLMRLPPLVLSLHDRPAATLDPDQPQAGGTAWGPRGLVFARRLRSALGDARPVRIGPPPAAEEEAWRAANGHGGEHMAQRMARRMGLGDGPEPDERAERTERDERAERRARGAGRGGPPVWRTEVQLMDGRWARFDAVLPPPAADRLPWQLAAQLAVLLLSVLLLAWLAVRWVVRPLHVLAGAAQALGQDLNSPPLPEQGPREVRQAAQAFNRMQQGLSQFLNERTRLLSALSHDLKTPLTRMRLRAELLDDEPTRVRFEADLQEMEAMVTETLAFMRGLGGHEARAPVDVNALAQALVADQAALGRQLRVQGQAAAPCVGVASLLKRALGNLLDNAALYGGAGPITLRITEQPGQLQLSVHDSGPGIPPAELERVFEPYHRLEASRSRATGGTGLGLGIARSIAQLHGGTLSLHNRPEGGLEARLVLPR